ncbi:unnamed protein product [Rangifer tarandus platyrhynchus]|uniref:Uncharacterized protein n=1 Tax=Rangifer tarandus platyrhynchus TaxID=3082113 RepID=A0AC59Z9W5_RANTA
MSFLIIRLKLEWDPEADLHAAHQQRDCELWLFSQDQNPRSPQCFWATGATPSLQQLLEGPVAHGPGMITGCV